MLQSQGCDDPWENCTCSPPVAARYLTTQIPEGRAGAPRLLDLGQVVADQLAIPSTQRLDETMFINAKRRDVIGIDIAGRGTTRSMKQSMGVANVFCN